jgi:hypothetical protein
MLLFKRSAAQQKLRVRLLNSLAQALRLLPMTASDELLDHSETHSTAEVGLGSSVCLRVSARRGGVNEKRRSICEVSWHG